MLDAGCWILEHSVDPAAQRNGLVFYPLLFKFRPLLHRNPYGANGISFIILLPLLSLPTLFLLVALPSFGFLSCRLAFFAQLQMGGMRSNQGLAFSS